MGKDNILNGDDLRKIDKHLDGYTKVIWNPSNAYNRMEINELRSKIHNILKEFEVSITKSD